MNISKLKLLLLAALCLILVVLSSAIQCMQVTERNDDFEAVVKRGYYDFLDRVRKEKFKELGLEDPVEAIYQRFLNGVLIYRPNGKTDNGRINLRILDLVNPLEGTFDLSQCGDMGKYISISTGYRKGKKVENANKLEIWFAPKFLIEKELHTTAEHFQGIMRNWGTKASVGIFWTWGSEENLTDYDYMITQDCDELSNDNLYNKWRNHGCHVSSSQRRAGYLTWQHTGCNPFTFIL